MAKPGLRRPLLLLAGLIALPALVLAVLSWRSLLQEREGRRAELLALASAAARAALRELEAELREIRDAAWRGAGTSLEEVARSGASGLPACARRTDGPFLYPRPLTGDGPSLEERVRREEPELLASLLEASDAEFIHGRRREASQAYARLADRVESRATRAALLYASVRASADPSGSELLIRDYPDISGETGLPFALLARVRLVRESPTPASVSAFVTALASSGIPGHDRDLLLRDLLQDLQPAPLALRRALEDARAFERIEDDLRRPERGRDDLLRIDEGVYLATYRPLPGGEAALAVRLSAFPGPAARAALLERDGMRLEIDCRGAAEAFHREASGVFPSLAVTAHLADPARLDPPAGRLFLTGGLVACLFAALLFGVVALVRRVGQEVALARLKGDFVSGVSHDLKTPLTSIRMFAELLETGRVTDEEKRREYHGLIHRESLRLSRLVENVLDFSRLEDGRKTYSFQQGSLRDAVRSAAETFKALTAGSTATFRVDLPEDPVAARIDADAIQGAVLNLLDNAFKYGGEPRRIELALAVRGDRAEIAVSDNGPGIPEAERERVFEKFYRGAAAAASAAGGAGLGLALVRHVAEAHGGSVCVEGVPCRFVLSVPR